MEVWGALRRWLAHPMADGGTRGAAIRFYVVLALLLLIAAAVTVLGFLAAGQS